MKKVKIFAALLGVLLMSQTSFAQDQKLNDLERIAIAPFVSDQVEYLPAAARGDLQSKLGQIISSNGFGSSLYNARFILTPDISVLSKNVVASAPPKVALKLSVNLMVGDGISGTKYGSTVLTVNGVGENENKAYISAMNQIRANDPEISRLIGSAKERILQFYNTECDFILREAEVAADLQNWDEALYILTSVPTVNKDCYDRATDLISSVYQAKVDRECNVHLLAAQNAWNAGQDYDAALTAVEHLQMIDPAAGCFGEALKLSDQIGKRIREIDSREWNFELKQLELEERKINAARDVGMAYGQNQPQNMTYNLRGWF